MHDFTPSPIIVNANPAADQAQALVRQVLLAAAAIASALGYAGVAGKLNLLLMAAGPIAVLLVTIWGQIRTRVLSQKAAAMANQLPDEVAQTK